MRKIKRNLIPTLQHTQKLIIDLTAEDENISKMGSSSTAPA
jgi:hypothetical protein